MRRQLLLALVLLGAAATAQNVHQIPTVQTSAALGQEMYRTYCASCHGLDGKGNGPASPALKTPPTDLTRLAHWNGGHFPEMKVFNAVAGDSRVAAHGSKDMPVWGTVFLRLGEGDASKAKLRIRNLTKYIASIQAQ